MEQNLRDLFDRALDDEPVPPPGDPARVAMAQGRRIRRRRGLLVGGAAATAVAAAAVAVNVAWAPAAPPPGISAAANPACTAPAEPQAPAPSVSIFLTQDITAAQRSALSDALRSDPAVRNLWSESRAQAFARFQQLWQDNPKFVATVPADSLPESFRITLADPSAHLAFEAKYRHRAGVLDVIFNLCPGAGR